MKTRLKSRLDRKRSLVELDLDRPDEEAFFRAAYLMMDRACVALGSRGAHRVAVLWPRKGKRVGELAPAFKSEYDNQLLRLAIGRQTRGLRAEVLRRALAMSEGAGPPSRAAASLPAGRRAEIERLLAEAEKGPRDPLGIAVPWDDSRRAR